MPRKARKQSQEATPDLPQDSVTMVLHPRQAEFSDCAAVYRAFCAGIGSGKTVVGSYDVLRRSQPGQLYAVVAPTFRMLEDATLRTFIDVAQKLNLWDEDNFFKSDMRAKLWNGAEVLFRSADNPGTLRGPTLWGCWLDECSQMKEEAFNVMIGRLRGGGQQGWLTGTFTPSGKEHWTYRIFGDKTNPNVALFLCSTKDNPFVTSEFYQTLLMQYGKGPGGLLRAKQELEGEFVCVEGSEWPPDWFGADIWFDDWPTLTKGQRVCALDSSKGRGGKTGDDSVFCKILYYDGLLWIDYDANNVRNSAEMAATAVEIQREFRPHAFGVEAEFGGDVLADDIYQRADEQKILVPLMSVPTQNVPKEVRIRRLTPYLQRKIMRWRNTDTNKRAINQMEVWPHSEHDDFPDATEMAIRILNETGLAA